jgi:tRNA-specific 2-thiouridylase
VVVGSHDELFRDDLMLRDVNWIDQQPHIGEKLGVQIRHRASEVEAEVVSFGGAEIELRLAQPQRAVTPGQSGALYRGEALIGGGRIA